MRKYGKSMFEILSEMNEATFTYDFFDANKPMSQIQADGRKYRVKLKVNKGKGSMGADEVVITGNEQDIVKYAQAHLDAGKRVRNLRDLKKDLNASYHDEETDLEEKMVTAVYTDKKTRKVMTLKFKDKKIANDFFRNNKIAAGQINFREEVEEETDLKEQIKDFYTSISRGKKPADGRRFRVKLKVNKMRAGPDELVITGREKDIIKYAIAHLDASPRIKDLGTLDLDIGSDEEYVKEKFSSIEPKVIDRIEKMMNGSRQEKDQIQNMLNYLMPREVVDMVRYKLKIKEPMGKIKIR